MEIKRRKPRPDVVIRNKSLKQRLAVSEAMIGFRHTKESKTKISNSLIGNKRHLGYKHSLETIEKIKEARKKQVGENHPRWKGGISKERDKVMHTKEYRDWRGIVFKRDDYTCVRCLNRGSQKIYAHHIIPFAVAPEERFESSNGATLCLGCHLYVHSNEMGFRLP